MAAVSTRPTVGFRMQVSPDGTVARDYLIKTISTPPRRSG
jgi:hypothetical protein